MTSTRPYLTLLTNADLQWISVCGTGELLSGLQKKAGFTVGVDSSRKMLDQAEKILSNNKTNIELRLGELEHLPLQNSEADLAVLSMVMHHLAEPEKVTTEVARILKTDGIFIIADFEKHTNEEMRKKFGRPVARVFKR